MSKNFLTNIDLKNNQLLNAVIQNVATDPAGASGQIIYNSTQNVFKYYNGTKWVALDISKSEVSSLVENLDLTKINWAGADATKAQAIINALNRAKDGSVKIDRKLINGLDEAISQASMTGQAIVDAINNQSDKTIQVAKIAGVDNIAQTKANQALASAKQYADTIKRDLLNSASSDYDTFKEIETAIKRNASELSAIRNVAKKYVGTVGDGTALEHTITHNLNTTDVLIQVRETVAPYEEVIVDTEIVNANSVKIRTATAIASTAKLKVIVIG